MSTQQAGQSPQRGATGHKKDVCPACGSDALVPFFAIERVPVFCNVQHESRNDALEAATAPIELALCESCELIANRAFDESAIEYQGSYENSLHFSPHFRTYAEQLAQSLIDRYQLHAKTIVDIGCGQGDFLKLICTLSGATGFGFDPSYRVSHNNTADASGGVTIIPEAYGESLMDRPAALVCCRHVLEHIPEPVRFLRSIRNTIGARTDTIVFFEVPNALWTVGRLGIWDILYEHCSYFTPTALANAFTQAGFDVIRTEETYGGQFLTIEARPSAPGSSNQPASPAPASAEVRDAVSSFSAAYENCVNTWKARLASMQSANETAVLWGAGTKGVMFLNTLAISDAVVPGVVDINPNKHGKFIAGTGQRIIAPNDVPGVNPDTVIVMNPLYVDEIKQTLANLDFAPSVVNV